MIRAYMLLFLTVCLAFLVGDDVQAVTVMSNTEILRQTEPITAYTLAGRATTINLPFANDLDVTQLPGELSRTQCLASSIRLNRECGAPNYRVRETTVTHGALNTCNVETSAPNYETG